MNQAIFIRNPERIFGPTDRPEIFIAAIGSEVVGRSFDWITVVTPTDLTEAQRERHDQWVNCCLRTRVNPGGRLIEIDDDLS